MKIIMLFNEVSSPRCPDNFFFFSHISVTRACQRNSRLFGRKKFTVFSFFLSLFLSKFFFTMSNVFFYLQCDIRRYRDSKKVVEKKKNKRFGTLYLQRKKTCKGCKKKRSNLFVALTVNCMRYGLRLIA